MSLHGMVPSLRRQWVSVIVGLALTGMAGYAVAVLVPPTYRAAASVLLLPSPETLPQGQANPFLYLGNATAMRDVVARSVMADAVSTPLLDGTVNTSYEVYPEATVAPIVGVVAMGPTQTQTIRTLTAVVEQIDRSLVEVQDGQSVPDGVRVVSQQLSLDSEADQVRSTTLRAVVATATLGLVGSVLSALWIDTLRRGKRDTERRDGPSEEASAQKRPMSPDPSEEQGPAREPPNRQPPARRDQVRARPAAPHHVSSD